MRKDEIIKDFTPDGFCGNCFCLTKTAFLSLRMLVFNIGMRQKAKERICQDYILMILGQISPGESKI